MEGGAEIMGGRRHTIEKGDTIKILVCTDDEGPYLDFDYIIRHKMYCTRKCDSWVRKQARCSEIELRVTDIKEIEGSK